MAIVGVPDWFPYMMISMTSGLAAIAALFIYFWWNDGAFGHTYGYAKRHKLQDVISIGNDMKIRQKPCAGDGITLEYKGSGNADAAKSYSPKDDTRLISADGVPLYLNYAPSYSTQAPQVIATVQYLKKHSKETMDLIEKYLKRSRSPVTQTFKDITGPDLDEHGEVKLDPTTKQPLTKIYRVPVTEARDALPALDEKPVDKDLLSPADVWNFVKEGVPPGLLLSPKAVYDYLAAINPYDLHVVQVKGEALGMDKERKRQSSEIMKFVGLGMMIFFACLGVGALYLLLGKA